MKIGWLVWEYEDDAHPTFYKEGGEPDYGFRKVRIVYAEVTDDKRQYVRFTSNGEEDND